MDFNLINMGILKSLKLAARLYGAECECGNEVCVKGNSVDVYLFLIILKNQIENGNIILSFSDIKNDKTDYLEILSKSILNIME